MRVNPKKEEEKEKVTLALLRATLRLAAAHGFTSLGLREVSRAADIAPTSFYRHFADMEALGLALIDEKVGPFLRACIQDPHPTGNGPRGVVEGIVSCMLTGVAEDPELVRFLLAERAGASPTFRAALRVQLSAVSAGLERALGQEAGAHAAKVPAYVADAAVALLLEACSQVLDEGPEHLPLVRDHLLAQIRLLLSGVARMGERT